jgi:hypothetical protein
LLRDRFGLCPATRSGIVCGVQIREAAERVLFAQTLEEKLALPRSRRAMRRPGLPLSHRIRRAGRRSCGFTPKGCASSFPAFTASMMIVNVA